MKRGTPDHPKVYALAEALGCNRPTAIGYLELLWHFTSTYAPQGNIGKYSDKRIEAALDWHGRVGRLLDSLSTSGWVVPDPRHRWLVHDWSDHIDRSTRQRLARSGLEPIKQNHNVTAEVCTKSETIGTIMLHPPEPVPEPVPGPGPHKRAHAQRALPPSSAPIPTDFPVSLVDPFDAFCEVFTGPIPDNTYQTFVAMVKTVEQAVAVVKNTALWCQTKRYGDGFHDAVKFLKEGAWRRPPPAKTIARANGTHDPIDDALEDLKRKEPEKWA